MGKYRKIGQLIAGFAATILVFAVAGSAFAAITPTLTAAGTGDGNSVQLTITADPNASVILDYTTSTQGALINYIGSTNSSGSLSTVISTSGYGITPGSTVYVTVDGAKSAGTTWPIGSTTGAFSLSQTSVVLTVGQSTTVSAYNSTANLYLSNNSNPSVANFSISGSSISVYGNTLGSTTASFCEVGNASTCASLYVTVGNGSTSALSFSISNVTVSPGQSVPITISGGTGTYTVLNNSNSTVIQTNISTDIITLSTNSTSGTSAITVCSSDMSSCGIINATASTVSTSPIVFSQTAPTVSVGQSLLIGLSGGSSSTYYVSANTSPSIVSTSLSGSTLTLVGETSGSSTVTVCSSSGSCGTLNVTVGYTSSGGALALSQYTASLLVGQVLSITVSGGLTPYSLGYNQGTIYQGSLNGNILTLSGIASGSGTLDVCSAGSNCVELNVIVNSSGSGTPISFSPSSASVAIDGTTAVSIIGSGGYYVSNSTNSSLASVTINGAVATITGLQSGSENVSICESSGQCGILFVSVGTTASSTAPSFSSANPIISIGQSQAITLSEATGSYYVSANSNPTAVAVTLVGSTLTVFGQQNGTSTITLCATGGSCANVTVTVGAGSSTSSTLVFSTNTLPAGTVGQLYSAQLSVSGGSGSYTYAVSSGSLPAGFLLSTGGLISGTPTVSGSSSFVVTATDTSSSSTATQSFVLAVNASGTGTTTTTAPTGSYPNGELINENGTISIVYQNTKIGFTNAGAFLGLGYDFANVTNVADSGLTASSSLVTTSNAAHPWGSWVLSAGTVYFVSQNGLIPVPDWNTFLGNGGQASFIVPANSYDLALPQLPIMVSSDSRV